MNELKLTQKTVNDILASHSSGNGSIKNYVKYEQDSNTLTIDAIKLIANDSWLKAYAIYALQKDISFLSHDSTPQALIDAGALSPLHYSKLIKNSGGLNFTKIQELPYVKSINTVEQEIIIKSKGIVDINELTAEMLKLDLQIEIVKETARSGIVIEKIYYDIIVGN